MDNNDSEMVEKQIERNEERMQAQQQNSLENHLILEVIFKFLCSAHRQTLANTRLVCKQWKQLSDKLWQANVETVVLIDDELFDKAKKIEEEVHGPSTGIEDTETLCVVCPLDHKGPHMLVSDFIKRASDPNDKLSRNPYSKYRLVSWKFQDEDFSDGDCVGNLKQAFWKLHGGKVKTLRLTRCEFPTSFNVFRQQFLRFLPNLKVLQFEDSTISSIAKLKNQVISMCDLEMLTRGDNEDADEFMHFTHKQLEVLKMKHKLDSGGDRIVWESVFRTFPNIESFTIENMDNSEDAMLPMGMFVSQLRKAVRAVPNLKSLNVMNITYPAASNSVSDLAYLGLSLEHLRMDIGYETNLEHIQQVIESQAETLKSLHLFRAPFSEAHPTFPCREQMNSLEELHLWGNVCKSLDFLRFMPNLKVLKWDLLCCEMRHNKLYTLLKNHVPPMVTQNIVESTGDFGDVTALSHIETLELHCQQLSVQSWQRLWLMMTNVKYLKCVVQSGEVLRIICEQWPLLEKIELMHGSCVGDDDIVTMRAANLREFKWVGCPCIKGLRMESFGPRGFLRFPNLTRVETFVQEEVGQLEKDNFADSGIHFVLHKERDYAEGFADGKCGQQLYERALLRGEYDPELFSAFYRW